MVKVVVIWVNNCWMILGKCLGNNRIWWMMCFVNCRNNLILVRIWVSNSRGNRVSRVRWMVSRGSSKV